MVDKKRHSVKERDSRTAAGHKNPSSSDYRADIEKKERPTFSSSASTSAAASQQEVEQQGVKIDPETPSTSAASKQNPKPSLILPSPTQSSTPFVREYVQLDMSFISTILDSHLANLTNTMGNQLGVMAVNLQNSLSFAIQTMFIDLDSRFNETIAVLKTDMTHIQNQQQALEDRIDYLERMDRLNDIILSGIPSVAGEDLLDIYRRFCKALKLENPPPPATLFRTVPHTDETSEAAITIKFESTNDKGRFLAAVRRKNREKGGLRLNDIGIGPLSEEPVTLYVNESLTSRNYAILKKALELRRQRQFTSVFTIMGRVYVRRSDYQHATMITRLSDLYKQSEGSTN